MIPDHWQFLVGTRASRPHTYNLMLISNKPKKVGGGQRVERDKVFGDFWDLPSKINLTVK
jgi:hypothetical protein